MVVPPNKKEAGANGDATNTHTTTTTFGVQLFNVRKEAGANGVFGCYINLCWWHHHWHQLLFKIRSCSPNGGGGVGVGGAPPLAPACFFIKDYSPNGLGAPPWAPAFLY